MDIGISETKNIFWMIGTATAYTTYNTYSRKLVLHNICWETMMKAELAWDDGDSS